MHLNHNRKSFYNGIKNKNLFTLCKTRGKAVQIFRLINVGKNAIYFQKTKNLHFQKSALTF